MTDAPGTSEAAFDAYVMVVALMEKLVTKGVLTNIDVADLLTAVAKDLGQNTKALAKPSTVRLRQLADKFAEKS